jgi:hypothetical protein
VIGVDDPGSVEASFLYPSVVFEETIFTVGVLPDGDTWQLWCTHWDGSFGIHGSPTPPRTRPPSRRSRADERNDQTHGWNPFHSPSRASALSSALDTRNSLGHPTQPRPQVSRQVG